MMKLVVLSCLVAVACGSLIAPFAPLYYGAPLLSPYNYRGPLSLAPGQPANILGADGRPLDTLDVNLDRSAHLTAKAYEGAGIHLLKKRSVALAAPLAAVHTAPLLSYPGYSRIAAAPLATPLAAPLAYSSLSYAHTPYYGYY